MAWTPLISLIPFIKPHLFQFSIPISLHFFIQEIQGEQGVECAVGGNDFGYQTVLNLMQLLCHKGYKYNYKWKLTIPFYF